MNDNYIHVWRGDYCNGHLFYSTQEEQLLVKINIETGRVELVCALQTMNCDKKHNYHQIVSIKEDELLAIPSMGNRILSMNLSSGEQVLYDFRDSEMQLNQVGKFTSCIKYRDKVFCFPGSANFILEIDSKTMAFTYHEEVIRDIDRIQGRKVQAYFGWGTIKYDNIVYAVGLKHNLLLEMNLDTKEYKITELSNEEGVCGFRGIALYNNQLYISNRKFRIRIFDLQSKEFIKQVNTTNEYLMLRECKKGVLLIPAKSDKYAFYTKNNQIEEVMYPTENCYIDIGNKNILVKDVVESERKYYIISAYDNMMVIVDKETGEARFLPLQYGKSMMSYLYQYGGNMFKEKALISNLIRVGLGEFIDYIILDR